MTRVRVVVRQSAVGTWGGGEGNPKWRDCGGCINKRWFTLSLSIEPGFIQAENQGWQAQDTECPGVPQGASQPAPLAISLLKDVSHQMLFNSSWTKPAGWESWVWLGWKQRCSDGKHLSPDTGSGLGRARGCRGYAGTASSSHSILGPSGQR